MSDLIDFLLARIYNDRVQSEFVRDQRSGQSEYDPWALGWHDEYDLLTIEPSRGIAEAEAKRRIVQDVSTEDYQGGVVGRTLKHLASAYADHPDYRQEWKP